MVKRRSSYLLLSLASGALTSATVLPGCETSCQGICLQPGDPYPPQAGTAASTAGGGGGAGSGPCEGGPCGLVIRPGNVAGAAQGGSGPISAGGGGASGNGESPAGEGGATP
jgi:hypothetical protein